MKATLDLGEVNVEEAGEDALEGGRWIRGASRK